MKYELGNFDGSQIRINTSLLPEYRYNSKMAHEMAHHYVTYLSTLGILQEIVKEFKGIDNKTYKYLFKRGNKVQEVTALFYEYVSGGDAEVKERFIKSLNGITTDVKQILIDLINDINCHTKKENYLDLIIEIGVVSLSANFQKMTINQFFCINPEKDLETFFRINNINPKRKFEHIVKNVGKKVLQDGFSNNIIQEIRKNNDEDIKFIVQDFNNVFRNLNGLSILDFQKKNFDLILYIIVKSNLKKREEISLKGIYQIPILSRMDVKYKELNKSEGKKVLKELLDDRATSFILLKEYSMFYSKKNVDLIIPKIDSVTKNFKPVIISSTLDKVLSQEVINIITRIPRSMNFDFFLTYFVGYVLKGKPDFDKKQYNFFILGNEMQMIEIIEELVDQYGEESLKYFYKDFKQGIPLISVFEAKNVNIILYSEYSLKREYNLKKLSDSLPDVQYNMLISLYLNLLLRTDLFDRI